MHEKLCQMLAQQQPHSHHLPFAAGVDVSSDPSSLESFLAPTVAEALPLVAEALPLVAPALDCLADQAGVRGNDDNTLQHSHSSRSATGRTRMRRIVSQEHFLDDDMQLHPPLPLVLHLYLHTTVFSSASVCVQVCHCVCMCVHVREFGCASLFVCER